MNAERFKSFLTSTHEPMRVLMLLSATVLIVAIVWFGIPVMKGIAHAAEAQAKQVEANTIAADLSEATKEWKAKIGTALDNFVEASADAKDISHAAKGQVAETFGNANQAVKGITGLIDDARKGPLPAFTAAIDSANGILVDAKPQLVAALSNVKDATGSLKEAAEILDTAMKDPDIKAFVDDAMKHGRSIIGNLDTVSGNLVLATNAGQEITVNLDRMTKDSADKLHQVLFPAPVHGFLPNVKRILSFLVTPVLEAGRIYLSLHTLPVKITNPVPILKAP